MTVEREPKFQAPVPPSKFFGSGHTKLLGFRLHSPGWKQRGVQPARVFTQWQITYLPVALVRRYLLPPSITQRPALVDRHQINFQARCCQFLVTGAKFTTRSTIWSARTVGAQHWRVYVEAWKVASFLSFTCCYIFPLSKCPAKKHFCHWGWCSLLFGWPHMSSSHTLQRKLLQV